MEWRVVVGFWYFSVSEGESLVFVDGLDEG